MKTKLTLLLLCIGCYSVAQNTITVRPQQYKELIYTLQKGETLGRNESQLLVELNGLSYALKTIQNNQYYLIKRGSRTKYNSFYYPDSYKNWKINTSGDQITVVNKQTQKKYGPYYAITAFYDYTQPKDWDLTQYHTESDLYGFTYFEQTKSVINGTEKVINSTFFVRSGKQPEGPFQNFRAQLIDEKNTIYTYSTPEGEYLSENGQISGPYQEIRYNSPRYDKTIDSWTPAFLFYKVDNIWKYRHPLYENYTFSAKPNYSISNGKLVIEAKIIEKENKNFILQDNGELIESSPNNFRMRNIQHEELEFKSLQYTTNMSPTNLYNVSFGADTLGVFSCLNTLSGVNAGNSSDFFTVALYKAGTGVDSSGAEGIYYYSPTIGLIGPYQLSGNDRMYFFGSNYGLFNKKDSTFIINDSQRYEHVQLVHFNQYPKNWWLTTKMGSTLKRYRNGKPYTGYLSPDQLVRENNENNPFSLITTNEKSYILPVKSSSLLGPVQPGSSFALAKDNATYAECLRNGNIILINKKAVSEGFNLIYNERLDAFHWLSMTTKGEIYLNTYELN